jgi:hypothetical protein
MELLPVSCSLMGILLQESTLHELVMVLLLAIRSVQVFAALQIWLTMHSFLICCYISRTFIEWKKSLAIYWLDKMNDADLLTTRLAVHALRALGYGTKIRAAVYFR